MRLTVAIPTFNRNAILLQNLKLLLPQLTQECKLLIIDNCSDIPVAETLKKVLDEFPAINVEIMRNRVNIGANANIMRCFELCETEWLWVLGDDDPPTPHAVESILKHIRSYPQSLYFNFLSGGYDGLHKREQPIFITGMAEFVERVDSIANIFFLSSGVHNVRAMRPNIRLGYAYAHTQPNFIPFFTTIGEEGVCCLSDEQIVTYNRPSAEEQQWSVMYFGFGIMTLLELPMSPSIRKKLAEKILASILWHEMFVLQLLLLANRDKDYRSALYLYDQLRYRLYYFDRNIPRRVKTFIYRLMIRFPFFSYRMIRLIKGEKANLHSLEDRLGRI
jgi:glycosyltransferase involved in cell wall biosynthesis